MAGFAANAASGTETGGVGHIGMSIGSLIPNLVRLPMLKALRPPIGHELYRLNGYGPPSGMVADYLRPMPKLWND